MNLLQTLSQSMTSQYSRRNSSAIFKTSAKYSACVLYLEPVTKAKQLLFQCILRKYGMKI